MSPKRLDMYLYAIRYYLQGDTWKEAVEYARRIVYGFKETKE